MSRTFTYYEGAERGSLELWWRDSSGALLNLSSGYTASVIVGDDDPRVTAEFDKTTGITLAAGTGTEAEGTPNMTIAWTASDLGAIDLPAGLREKVYRIYPRVTTGGLDRDFPEDLFIRLRRRASFP